ncbi:CBS domain-containing protein [Cytobacillus sp. NCCP-133]|nr:CBS domain-containing protein [Cytobacillus sp. NCCP-133]GLB59493.1 hypothetical protein NCCP133_16260 [Cytobacillus sp. NCCP-133]
MEKVQTRRLPILDDGKLVGIVSLRDLDVLNRTESVAGEVNEDIT